ncbi:recombinase family protein [Paractinoplanes hotanensis]|uniref:Recombinase family protein n=1 Tax=Paractinoplanes hotanensis TaxID=2906497 RepID=A0ABT0Y302_9ACTN|nr:recombinase family protein [Actinoplanes hotanensis]MCM4080422.1 recombinase family protein [Actinoplanes hotanensis]
MRAAVYLRISQDRTGQELGVDRQREDCVALIRSRGDQLVGEFVDNDTPAKGVGKRDEYARLLEAVQRGEIDRIYVWSQGRLWRNRVERAQGFEILRDARVSLVQVKGPEVDMTTAMGRMIAGIIGEFDTGENEIKSERQVREARQRADRGLPPTGRRAFGYDGVELVEGEAQAVRDAYSQLLDGKTLTSIAAGLTAAGWTTTVGKPWNTTGLRSMLLNPRYAGQRWHLGEYRGAGAWPALVDEATFEAARSILSTPGRRPAGDNALRWLGSGYYLCGRCTADVAMKATYRGIVSRGTQARIYKCPACSITRVAEPVDHYVTLVVLERLRRPDLADLLAAPAADLRPLQEEAKQLRDRRKAVPRLFALGTLTEAEAAETRQIIDDRLAEIRATFAGAGRKPALGEVLDADDPGQAWLDLGNVRRQQSVLRELMTVRLLPVGPGRKPFDPSTVDIT